MRQSGLVVKWFLGFTVIFALGGSSIAEAGSFTFGFKAWAASLSAANLDGGDDLFGGLYLSWDVNDRLWFSAGYLKGEVDYTVRGTATSGSLEEVDSDLVVGWSLAKLDIGVGYRFAEFTTIIEDTALDTTSSGPMVYLGGSGLIGESSRWGYYGGVAYMFEDFDDNDGSQKQINGEAGFRWTSKKDFSILFGYRYKEYSGEGSADASFDGPVVNLAYTWR